MSKRIIINGKYNLVTCDERGCEFAFDKTDVDENGIVTCPQCEAECTATVKA